MGGLQAQKLVTGEKAPDVKVSEWLWGAPADDNKAMLIEFFHSGSRQCVDRIGNIETVALKYKGKLNVVLLAKEPAEGVRGKLAMQSGAYFAAIDEGGRTFEAFGVKFVPFCVLIDHKGRVLWSGNPSSLDSEEIGRLIK